MHAVVNRIFLVHNKGKWRNQMSDENKNKKYSYQSCPIGASYKQRMGFRGNLLFVDNRLRNRLQSIIQKKGCVFILSEIDLFLKIIVKTCFRV